MNGQTYPQRQNLHPMPSEWMKLDQEGFYYLLGGMMLLGIGLTLFENQLPLSFHTRVLYGKQTRLLELLFVVDALLAYAVTKFYPAAGASTLVAGTSAIILL